MTVSTFTAAARALKERQKNRNLPSVEIPVVKEDELARTLQGIQEHLRMYEGDSGAPKERFVTIAELENAGLIKSDVKGRFAFISQTLGKDVSQKAGSTLNPTQNDPVKNDTSRQPMKPGAGSGGGSSKVGSVATAAKLNDSQDVNVAKPVKNEFLYYDGNKFTNYALFKKENKWLGAQRFDKPLRLQERTDGPDALDGLGYLWVKDDTPNTLWFTDDAGTETQLGTGGALTPWTEDIDGGGFGLDNIDRLEIQASGVATDTATFTHDGTDFNTAFANTTDWNITGLTTLKAGNYTFNVDETVGAGQDNFVLTYDNGTGEIGLEAAGGGVSQLTDLSDVNTATITNRFVLVADGVDFESRALVEADISDLGTYASQLTELSDVNTATVTNRNVLVADGVDFESRALVEADISDLGTYASQLTELSDVNTATVTNRNVLVADGVDFESRALVEADISDLGTYAASSHTHTFDSLTSKTSGTGTYTTSGSFTASTMTATTRFISDSTGTNSDPGADNAYLTGYGVIGNRTTTYFTNANATGAVVIGNNGAHNANRIATFDSNGLTLPSGYFQVMNGTDYIRIAHDGTDANITTNATTDINFDTDINLVDNKLIRPEFDDYSISDSSQTVSANAVTVTYTTSQSHDIDLAAATGNVTITVSGGPPAANYGEMIIRVVQDATADRTLTWAGGTFVWPDATEIEPHVGAGSITIYFLMTWNGGTTWYINGVEFG